MVEGSYKILTFLQIAAAEDLLELTRELKEMWLFGPLRRIHEGEGEGKMDQDSKVVGGLIEEILQKQLESTKVGTELPRI
jgi:hypothetical protein